MSQTLAKALEQTRFRDGRLPRPFSIEFIKYDSNRSRGRGKSVLKQISQAVKVKSNHNTKANATLTVQDLNTKLMATLHTKLIMKINDEWVV